MKKRFYALLSVLLLIPILFGCASAPTAPVQGDELVFEIQETLAPTPTEERQEFKLEAEDLTSSTERLQGNASLEEMQLLASGLNEFAFDMLAELNKEDAKNRFFSPYSISLALTMTYAGADGQTAQEMADVFHYPTELSDLHGTVNSLDEELYKVPNYLRTHQDAFRLNIINTLFGQSGFDFSEAFLEELALNYGAGLKLVDFGANSEKIQNDINNWVANETEDRIKNLIPDGFINDFTRLVLVNAIYFNAQWLYEFSEANTKPGDFYKINGKAVQVDMMEQENEYYTLINEEVQIVQMPYLNRMYSMVLLMPKEENLHEWVADLSSAEIEELLTQLEYQNLLLKMPKFEFNDEFSGKKILIDLGMPSAFNSQEADFSKTIERDVKELFISDVFHKSFIAVNEEGTEAAAATAVLEEATSEPPKPIPLVFDHPFLFLIQERETGIILFMGEFVVP